MKRIITFIIAAAIIATMTACGGTPTDDLQEPVEVLTETDGNETEESDEPENDPPEEQDLLGETQTGETEDENQEQQEAPENTVTIEEKVLVDEAGVKITAKGLNEYGIFGPEVKLLIENNSGKDLTFQCRDTSVNGYMVQNMMSVDVVDGKKANDALYLMSSDLEMCGIDQIADIELSFHIFTTEDWEDYLDTQMIKIETSIASEYEYGFDDSGDLAYEENGMKVVIKGLSENSSIIGPGIIVYIENNSDKDITVQTRDVSINGFMVETLFSTDVLIGKHAVSAITFLSSELEENGITEIETVELSFHIFDSNEWETIADTEAITINF